MKNQKKRVRLTNSEFAMMQLLWEAGRPLNRAEIMQIAQKDADNPLFAKNSFHVIINNLMNYEFITAFMNNGAGRKNARRFAPMITRNEYFAQQIATTEFFTNEDIPEIVSALFKCAKVSDRDAMLHNISKAISTGAGK